MMRILALLLTSLLVFNAEAKLVEEELYVFDLKKQFQAEIESRPELTIDHVEDQGYEVYGPKGTSKWLQKIGAVVVEQEKIDEKLVADYPSPEQIIRRLESIHARYPNLTKLIKIGESVEGRPLMVMKISDHPNLDEDEPAFKYIANMHGNEIVGRGLMALLIEDLLQNYSQDPKIKRLVDETEIFIMPSMNPDGAAARRRSNANFVDLNRDFPDFTTRDNKNTPEGRQPETQAVMRFQEEHCFQVSANFHGGAQVVNYPWDTTSKIPPNHDWIRQVSSSYASKVNYMRNSGRWPGGIVRGSEWYSIDGSMQDWSYHWYGDMQVTIELSNSKWPRYSEVLNYYNKNRRALIDFIDNVHGLNRENCL